MTLTNFLLARIAEREAAITYAFEHGLAFPVLSPAEMLAECEAKKSIVAECRALIDSFGDWDADPDAVVMWPDVNRRERSQARGRLHTLAAIYADHPDYRDEWKV